MSALAAKLTATREKLGRAIQAARDIAAKIHTAEEKNEATADFETQFEAANGEAQTLVKYANRLEAEIALESEQEKLRRPATERLGYHGSDREIRSAMGRMEFESRRQARQHERMLRSRLELFGRAGVTDKGQFEKFRDAHSDATAALFIEGATAAARTFEAAGFKPMESMALVTTQGDLGGFLVAEDLQSEVLRDLPAFTSIRPKCRVITTGSSIVTFPTIVSATSTRKSKYTSGYTGAWKQEGYVTGGTAPPVQNQPRVGQHSIHVMIWAPDAVELTVSLISDSRADIEGIISELIAETYGLDGEDAFLNGSGISMPLGIHNAGLDEIKSGDANLVKYDGLIDLFTGLPAQYRRGAAFIMNSLTFGAILKLKDSQNMPLFPVNQLPGTLWGKEVLFSEFMPDVAANAFPVIFGDLRYYGIADRQELRVQRLVEKFAPNIGILPTVREGGNVLRKDAFRRHKIAA